MDEFDAKLKEKLTQPVKVVYHNQVIKRVLHTRTEINIYPNGQCFQSSKSWFEDKIYPVTKKAKDTITDKCIKSEGVEEL